MAQMDYVKTDKALNACKEAISESNEFINNVNYPMRNAFDSMQTVTSSTGDYIDSGTISSIVNEINTCYSRIMSSFRTGNMNAYTSKVIDILNSYENKLNVAKSTIKSIFYDTDSTLNYNSIDFDSAFSMIVDSINLHDRYNAGLISESDIVGLIRDAMKFGGTKEQIANKLEAKYSGIYGAGIGLWLANQRALNYENGTTGETLENQVKIYDINVYGVGLYNPVNFASDENGQLNFKNARKEDEIIVNIINGINRDSSLIGENANSSRGVFAASTYAAAMGINVSDVSDKKINELLLRVKNVINESESKHITPSELLGCSGENIANQTNLSSSENNIDISNSNELESQDTLNNIHNDSQINDNQSDVSKISSNSFIESDRSAKDAEDRAIYESIKAINKDSTLMGETADSPRGQAVAAQYSKITGIPLSEISTEKVNELLQRTQSIIDESAKTNKSVEEVMEFNIPTGDAKISYDTALQTKDRKPVPGITGQAGVGVDSNGNVVNINNMPTSETDNEQQAQSIIVETPANATQVNTNDNNVVYAEPAAHVSSNTQESILASMSAEDKAKYQNLVTRTIRGEFGSTTERYHALKDDFKTTQAIVDDIAKQTGGIPNTTLDDINKYFS